MSLRDRLRANQAFEVDDAVRKVLKRWSKEQGSRSALVNLEQGVLRLTLKQRRQLADRLAEISLGMLFAIEQSEQ
jgi:predicted N-formylglutamate amidohydrolase